MDAKQGVLTALEEIDAARAERVRRPAFDEVRQAADTLLDLFGRHPRRPLFLAADLGDAVPGQRILADRDTVTDRLLVRQYVVEIARVGIDHDRASGFGTVIVDDVAPIGLRNVRLRVGR